MAFWNRSKSKSTNGSRPAVISGPIGSDLMESYQGGGIKRVKDVIFAGHGSFNTITDAKYPKVRLPKSVTLVFWCRHGEALLNHVAMYIEQRQDLRDLPEYLKSQLASEGLSRDIPEIVPGGSEIWNYRLTYPSGLALGRKPETVPSSVYNPPAASSNPYGAPVGAVGDRRYCVVPPLTGDVKDRGVPIIALLAHWNMVDGATVHWCACRSISAR